MINNTYGNWYINKGIIINLISIKNSQIFANLNQFSPSLPFPFVLKMLLNHNETDDSFKLLLF